MLSIGEFSKASKVTTNTLRYYDEIGLLKPAQINHENGYRYYNSEQLSTMLLINKLKQYSFSLEEIAKVLESFDNSEILSLMKKKYRIIQRKIDDFSYTLEKLSRDISELERGEGIMSYINKIEVNLIKKEKQNVLSIRENITLDDYTKFIGKLYETAVREKLTILGAPMSIYHAKEFDPENFDAEVAIPVKETGKGIREIPEYLCAVVMLKGPYSGLTDVYVKLNQWVDKNEYELVDSPFEVYLSDPTKTPPEEYLTEVCFPVRSSK